MAIPNPTNPTKTHEQYTEAERVVKDAQACDRWWYELSTAYAEQRRGAIAWNLSIDDLKLYHAYKRWADYRVYRYFFDRDPEQGKTPDQAPACLNPSTTHGEGPRYFHDARDDAIRFLHRRRLRQPVDPRYTVRTPLFRTVEDVRRAYLEIRQLAPAHQGGPVVRGSAPSTHDPEPDTLTA